LIFFKISISSLNSSFISCIALFISFSIYLLSLIIHSGVYLYLFPLLTILVPVL
jgi:hypothetical protein